MSYDEKKVHDEFFDETKKEESYEKGMHPVELYRNGDLDARSDVLLTHPDVIGFLFVHEGILTKAYLPKKVVNFGATKSEERKSIVAVSGTCSEYTPFSVSEQVLLSDVYYVSDCDNFKETFPVSNITKFVKDNKSKLPEEHKDITKSKKSFMVSVPNILPIVAGNKIREGRVDEDRTDDEEVIEKEYEAYIFLLNI